jgi:O-antigen/teichoic acid export membrane protein
MKDQFFRLGKNSITYGTGTMLTRFINLLLLPLFTAYLTPKDYGVLALLALLTLVAQPLFSLGLNAAMGPCYFEENKAERKWETVWTSFLILLISSIVLSSIAWLFPRDLSILILRTSEYGQLVSLTLTGCAFGILSSPFMQRIQFEEKAKTFVILALSTSLISIILCVVTVVIFHWGVMGMVISQLIGQMITFLFFFIAGAKGTKFIYSKPIAKELLRLGIQLIPSFVFLFILMQSNRYILQWYGGLEQVGIYSIGYNIGMVMSVAVSAVSTAWYPFFMTFLEKQKDAEILFGRIFTYYIYIFGSLCMLFFVGAKLIVTMMTQPAFHKAYIVVGFAASAQFFIGAFNMFLPGMYYKKEMKYVSLVQGLTATISIGLNIVLIKWVGLLGAGISLSLSHLLMAVFQYLWNVHRKDEYIRIKYEWSRLACFMILFLFITAATFVDRKANLLIETSCIFILVSIIFISNYMMLSKSERTYLKEKLLPFRAVKE